MEACSESQARRSSILPAGVPFAPLAAARVAHPLAGRSRAGRYITFALSLYPELVDGLWDGESSAGRTLGSLRQSIPRGRAGRSGGGQETSSRGDSREP